MIFACLSTADGQLPVKNGPGHCLFAPRSRHGADVAIVAVEVVCRWDNVPQAKAGYHRAAAWMRQEEA